MLVGAGALTLALFSLTRLDVAAARPFYDPGGGNPWPLAHRLPWSALYRAAPYLTAGLLVAGLGALGFGLTLRREAWLRNGVFLLLSVLIGPGLIANFVFKDHWGRPRPRDLVEFGGPSAYVAPLVPSHEGGASFPCGHCSVGFLYAAGWWIWRRTRPRWAQASLALGLTAGFALGLGRMAAGGHFLSDAVWAGLIAMGTAHLLHDHLLRLPIVERALAQRASARGGMNRLRRALVLLAAAGSLGVLLVLFVTPHGSTLEASIPLPPGERSAWCFELTARRANVDLVLEEEGPEITIEGELHGFGLPASRLGTRSESIEREPRTIRYEIVQQGWFTDLDGSARVQLPVRGLVRIRVNVEHGNIRVLDPAGIASGPHPPALELSTRYGHVIAPPHPTNLGGGR